MSIRKLATLGLLAAALVVTALVAARAQARSTAAVVRLSTVDGEFVAGVQNEGWWNDAGIHLLGFDEYLVGRLGEGVRRDFFTFDTSRAPGCARSATLQIPHGIGSGDFGFLATLVVYALHDVRTDALTLNTTAGPDTTIFDDLGSGLSYGTAVEPTGAPYRADSFVVTLNAAGLAGLNAAIRSGSFFSVGGMVVGERMNFFLFEETPVGGRPTNLILTVGPCPLGS
jgi:hypothetical protein